MTTATTFDDGVGCPSGLEPPADGTVIDPAPFVKTEDGTARLELAVFGAKCAGCIQKIEGGLNTLPGVENARLNLSTGRLSVSWRAGAFAPKRITETVTSLGYRAAPFDPEKAEAESDAEGRKLLRSLAVAGFAEDDLAITVEDSQLVIRGRQSAEDDGRIFLHRGIAARQFQRSFVLADGVEVAGAELENGLLHVDLERAEPETVIRKIAIGKKD